MLTTRTVASLPFPFQGGMRVEGLPTGLGNLFELFDTDLLRHCEKVADYALQIASFLNLTEKDMGNLYWSAMFHDIGKVLIPRNILLKPDTLTPGEFEHIKTHPHLGLDLVASVLEEPYVNALKPGILYHHERYDGLGYPHGLKGTAIPLTARILAIADVYDALTSDRPHRKALSPDSVVQYLIANAGTIFDPSLVSPFRTGVVCA